LSGKEEQAELLYDPARLLPDEDIEDSFTLAALRSSQATN
jgi:hypothetical protein